MKEHAIENGWTQDMNVVWSFIGTLKKVTTKECSDLVKEYGVKNDLLSTKVHSICRFIRHSDNNWKDFMKWSRERINPLPHPTDLWNV